MRLGHMYMIESQNERNKSLRSVLDPTGTHGQNVTGRDIKLNFGGVFQVPGARDKNSRDGEPTSCSSRNFKEGEGYRKSEALTDGQQAFFRLFIYSTPVNERTVLVVPGCGSDARILPMSLSSRDSDQAVACIVRHILGDDVCIVTPFMCRTTYIYTRRPSNF